MNILNYILYDFFSLRSRSAALLPQTEHDLMHARIGTIPAALHQPGCIRISIALTSGKAPATREEADFIRKRSKDEFRQKIPRENSWRQHHVWIFGRIVHYLTFTRFSLERALWDEDDGERKNCIRKK